MKPGLFVSAYRNYKKNKITSLIKILGLALGMACVVLISLWIQDEYSYDRFNENLESLYRIEEEQHYDGLNYHVTVTPCPMAEAFRDEFPEIIRSSPVAGFGRRKITYQEKSIYDSRILAVDPDFLKMFSFTFISGDRETALNEKYSIVISKDRAHAIFGEENPVGKKLRIDDEHILTVTGIMEDVPRNSSLNFEYLVPLELQKEISRWSDSWGNNNIPTFVQLAENASVPLLTQKINKFFKEKNEETTTKLVMAPLKRIHLYSYFGYKVGLLNAHYVYIFSVIAVFILIIASINFMNLSTAQSIKRSKDIGIQKTNGANRLNIISHFLGESLVYSLISLFLSFAIIEILLPAFNNLTEKQIEAAQLFTPANILIFVSVMFISSIVAGVYPAVVLSKFKPAEVLKGKNTGNKGTTNFNKGLVVFQFVISIFLIIGTILTYKQVYYLKSMDIGFDKDNVISIDMSGELHSYFDPLSKELEGFTGILSLTGANNMPFSGMGNTSGVYWKGKSEGNNTLINFKGVGYNYLTTMGIKLIEGRDANKDFPSDAESAIIVNEEFRKMLGAGSALGKKIKGWGSERSIIGVVKDFHFSSSRDAVEPLIMQILPGQSSYMFIKIDPERSNEVKEYIQRKWAEIIPDVPLNLNFIDQTYDNLYQSEERTSALVRYFALIAVLIACLGLLGLSLFMIQNRIKEIGVRKVNGARVSQVTTMLNMDFIKWVTIAFIIACPISWFSLNKWLENFAYQTEISWWIFALAGLLALGVSLITVSWQTFRAARRNPVEALRYE
jgi:putative ABC transport system permease protein